jgi:flagella basal body P-ring formation protein FlgA
MPPRTLTVKQLLPAGHVIAASDLDWVYSHHAEGETRIDEIVGMETMRALRPGMPIPMNDLRKKPYVRARDLVSVHARQGAITVKQPMRALGTGGLGEAVTFVTLDGKERFTARITGYHEAEVIETYAPVNP